MIKSKISLVGAGPGDPDLITVKGMKAISEADVILYDALSAEALLDYASPECIKVYVGKRCGRHSLKQADINALILKYAKEYRHVVRLKGGDPYVFGRGHEEKVSLEKLGFDVRVIPGISSATSLPLIQGVPLTRRNVSESFWVMTGTTKKHQISADIYLAAKSNATAVILMGMNKLSEIAEIYCKEGKKDIPVMVISKGSTQDEAVVIASAKDIAYKVKEEGLPTPGIIVIGEVVHLHPSLVKEKAMMTWK